MGNTGTPYFNSVGIVFLRHCHLPYTILMYLLYNNYLFHHTFTVCSYTSTMLIVYDCTCFALAIATQLATYDNVLFLQRYENDANFYKYCVHYYYFYTVIR